MPFAPQTSIRLMASLRRTCPPGTRIIRRTPNTSASSSANTSPTSARSFSSATWVARPYKNDQDRESLKPGSQEYSKSGGDDAAAHSDAAFDPSETRPETEAEDGSSSKGALDVSPANQKVSQGKDSGKTEKGAPDGDRNRTSGAGSAPKHGSR